MTQPVVFPIVPLADYALLDSGRGEKLERVGPHVLRRPDPQAMWRPALGEDAWAAADLVFERESDRGGRWRAGPRGRDVPESWTVSHGDARFIVRPTPFKHIGLFPEQATNWHWTGERIAEWVGRTVAAGTAPSDRRLRLLNLFAYTGAATVLATRAGAFVTHVDASRPALRWAKENAQASGLAGDAIRWIEDDAATFLAREQRRGRRYDGILLDPPPYGRGPKSEKWVFEEQIVDLLGSVAATLADGPAFVVLSCYAVGTSPLAFANMLADLGPGEVEAGELAIAHETGERLLPAGLCGRWRRSA